MLMRVHRTPGELGFGLLAGRHQGQRGQTQHALRDSAARRACAGHIAFGNTTHDNERTALLATKFIRRHRAGLLGLLLQPDLRL
jgi:hypothetical protein